MLVIVNYSEIKLKGKNRVFFEKKLFENISYALKKNKINFQIFREFGKIKLNIFEDEKGKTIKILSDIPGISTFYFPITFDIYEEKLFDKILKLLMEKKFNTFAVRTKRVNKKFPKNSQEINVELGSLISSKGFKVDLEKPELEVNLRIYHREIHLFFKKYRGPDGLPIGTSGKLISLISGGIDSPVAAKLMAIRGGKIIFLHFHNLTSDSCGVKNKIVELSKKINENAPETKLYLVPFENIQKEIITFSPPEYRMILYRRSMFRIGNMVCDRERAKGFITGDSLGQVASQTIDNINVIYDSSKYPVFSPLIGINKSEVVEKSRKFGLYEISILPYNDCCSLLVAKHPETRAKLDKIVSIEKRIDLDELEKKTFLMSEIIEIK